MTLNKIALGQITTDPGRLTENRKKILATAQDAAKQGADLLVLPELCLPGYAHMDLCYHLEFLSALEDELKSLIKELPSELPVVLGSIHHEKSENALGGRPFLYNSLYLVHAGEVRQRKDKCLLPSYDVFSESRYFQRGEPASVFEFAGKRLAFSVCEDLWDTNGRKTQIEKFKAEKPDLIISINASPFSVGKPQKRHEVFAPVASELSAPLLYCNLIGSFDCYDSEVVFDGSSFVLDSQGNLTDELSSFKEQLQIVDLGSKAKAQKRNAELSDIKEALVLGSKEYFRRNGLKEALLGVSGGIDSAVVAAILCEALGKENVTGLTMPSHVTSDETLGDSHLLGKRLGMQILEFPIGSEYEAWLKAYKEATGEEPDAMAKQNKQSRIRGANLMSLSNSKPASLVIATGNKTELATGYCTLYGDMNGAFCPLGDLSKIRVFELARFINEEAGRELIPVSIIERPPTAELEEGQTDAASLPADYDILSPLVEEIIETDFQYEDLSKRYPKEALQKTLTLIHHNEYKRRQASPSIRITERGFGIERRVPMGNGFLLFRS